METTVDVLVVGAGPTGLLLAAELVRRGVACRIIDEHPASLAWDRATVVHPRTLEIFDSLGIVEQLLSVGVRQRKARIHSDGHVLGEIDLSNCGSRYGFNIGVSEEVTERILADYLSRRGGEVVRASRLADMETRGDGVLATIAENGGSKQVFAQWVVGCDGSHSVTRKIAGIELEGRDIPEPWAVFDAAITDWPEPYEANYAYLDEIPLILTALPERRWRAYVRPNSPESDLVADATSTIGRYLPAGRFVDVVNPTRFHCHSKVAKRYRAGRILLAGDAAHLCSPAQGHGMNSGLQDAFNLAWKLALVCKGHASPTLLDTYEAERRPVARAIVASGDEVEHAQLMGDPAARRARDEGIRARFADQTTRHDEAVAEAELDIDYGASPIVMGDGHKTVAPGQRLPDRIEVRRESGETCWMHELADREGNTALLIGGASVLSYDLARLESEIESRKRPGVMDDVVVLSARSDEGDARDRLELCSASELGIEDVTLLVMRPDGHVGLRADRMHDEALTAYLDRLCGVPAVAATP
jgi:2-polyprenyl-6-methoxyphenol hydroxylase-like FAD-dependent oxidoreductase